MHDSGYFGKESITWRIGKEAILTLGGARAVMMQLAHPLVAMGVAEHSSYMSDPFGRTERTFMLGQMLTFGTTHTARLAARTINRLHTHVYGQLTIDAGAYARGTPYYAHDPELLLWVHATLVDTVLLVYPLFVGPLSQEEQEQYYQESKALARLLGLPASAMPQTVTDLQQYVHAMVHSNQLASTPQARQLVQQLLFPPVPTSLRPLLYLNLYITSALLPQPIRELYDIHWGPKREEVFNMAATGIRILLPHLPAAWRILPVTNRMIEKGDKFALSWYRRHFKIHSIN
jgi:uncharacterized protein (DUF2236 family)